jgi:hypothetical protein
MDNKKIKVKVIKRGVTPTPPSKEENKTKVSFGEFIPRNLERKLRQKELWEADKASRLLQESEERKANAIRLLFGE